MLGFIFGFENFGVVPKIFSLGAGVCNICMNHILDAG